jgi:hypothetical protein
MGRVAEGVLGPLVAALGGVALVRVPHPSDQGLLMAAAPPPHPAGRRAVPRYRSLTKASPFCSFMGMTSWSAPAS